MHQHDQNATAVGEISPDSGTVDRLLTGIGRLGPTLLRVSLAVVFVWFGALKVFDVSPVADLVGSTIPLPQALFVPVLGLVEVGLGAALLVGRSPLIGVAIAGHLVGTFLVLVTQPELAFQNGNLLLPTTEGEFVLKNLVLVAAALTVAGTSVRERNHRARDIALAA